MMISSAMLQLKLLPPEWQPQMQSHTTFDAVQRTQRQAFPDATRCGAASHLCISACVIGIRTWETGNISVHQVGAGIACKAACRRQPAAAAVEPALDPCSLLWRRMTLLRAWWAGLGPLIPLLQVQLHAALGGHAALLAARHSAAIRGLFIAVPYPGVYCKPSSAHSPSPTTMASTRTGNAALGVVAVGTLALAAAATYKYAYKHEPLPKVVSGTGV